MKRPTKHLEVRPRFHLRLMVAISSGLFLSQVPFATADADSTTTGGSTSEITLINGKAALSGFQPETSLTMPGKPAPLAAGKEFYKGAKEGLSVGIWEGKAGILKIDSYPHDEFCVLITGELVITDAKGKSHTYGPGDTFVIPKGFSGTWDMKTTTRKYYAVTSAAQ